MMGRCVCTVGSNLKRRRKSDGSKIVMSAGSSRKLLGENKGLRCDNNSVRKPRTRLILEG